MTEPKRKKRITLIEILVIVAVTVILGRLIYHVIHWREAVDAFEEIGLWGSLVAIAAVVAIRRWIDSL